jgi:apolipoprotein N-acyltransferase
VKLAKTAHSIVLAWGWRRVLIAFAAGAVSAAAMAPFNAWPLLLVTFPVLVWLIDGAAAGRMGGVPAAAAAGWWFGFGYFVAGLYWIGNAFLVDAKTFGWLLPFAVLGLPAYLALYTGLGAALARLLWTRGPTRVLALALALTLTEWLRGHLLTGFPWNAFGYALTGPLAMAQGAALIGIWGLTFVAVAVFASPAVLVDERADTPRPWLPVLLGVAVLMGLAAYGTVRLARTPTTFVDGVRLRIMQPNLPQDAKFNYSAKAEVMRRYLTLSDRATGPQTSGVGGATHLIWPESAFPFFLTREADAMAQIAGLQLDLRDRPRRIDPGSLRQGSPRPVRGVSAVPEPARAARPHPAHQDRRRLPVRRPAPRPHGPGGAALPAAGLLRDRVSRPGGAARRAARLAAQSHQ